MRTSADTYLAQVNKGSTVRRNFHRLQWLLTLLVIPAVFWCLKLTGITMAGEAFCGMDEHEHGDTCVLQEVICEIPETPAHLHTDACLNAVLNCTLPEQEGHTHSDDCCSRVQICSLEESQGHSHQEACYTREWFCDITEEASHRHGSDCYVQKLCCGLEESEEHSHDETCMISELVCQTPEAEGHTHGSECYADVIICQEQEAEGHSHSSNCFVVEEGYVCGLAEGPAHFHTTDCFLLEEGNFTCGLEETEGHAHNDDCYRVLESCPVTEHIHTPDCYSDISADLETSTDWEASLKELNPSENLIENIIMVARSQLGETESTRNFQVDELGVRRGITRYGQWYGNPYGDWSAMFVSFCLEYAGAEDLPRNAGVEAMRLEWEKEALYAAAEDYAPGIGDIVFWDKDADDAADSVAIVADVEDGILTVIQGDFLEDQIIIAEALREISGAEADTIAEENADEDNPISEEAPAAEESVSTEEPVHLVAETACLLTDPTIMGYGIVPIPQPVHVMVASPRAASTVIAKTINFSTDIFGNASSRFVIYTESNGKYFAIDGNGDAVQIYIDADGNIFCDTSDISMLYWSISRSQSNYRISNARTKVYLAPNNDNVIRTSSADSQFQQQNGGIKIRSGNTNHVRFNADEETFIRGNGENEGSVFYLGQTLVTGFWMDGTDGGLRVLGGAEERYEIIPQGSTYTLPAEWVSPEKYSYKIRGWYEITTRQYYQPGDTVEVTENMVFYADWVPATYDIGVFNEYVTNTVSTNGYITTRLYDYNYLFNIQSANAQVNASSSSHSETWSMISSGNVQYENQNTFNFVFGENDSGGKLSNPNNRSDDNRYHDAHTVSDGIYNAELGELLFGTDNDFNPETGEGIIGKTYLGTGDHLLQLMDDPDDPHYGYYYYDSKRNAASFNQSKGRFYVYDYLSATSDSIGGAYSDFLPLNSPYIAPEGKTVGTYTYDGVGGEYKGVTHYRYDSAYNSGDHNSVNNVYTDYAYGMRMDVNFFLPNDPGSNGNKDLYGNDTVFEFSGDDDLWVLIDGVVALDIGGIHQSVPGTINFSTGEVKVNDKATTSLMDLKIKAGDHVMTVLYLERGSSMSNCSIYFNLMPRYGLEIRKEDVLTQDILDGTQFTVYEDLACTIPAELWDSEAAYKQDLAEDGIANAFHGTFTVTNGVAKIWGLGSGNTYYIKETGAPKVDGYGLASGLIKLTLSKDGQATYNAEVIPEGDGTKPSHGFTIHGVRIDEATKTVYMTATNAPETVTETTTVQVVKKWEDGDTVDHSDDYIKAYLTVKNPDGTSRHIREVVLSDENNWQYMWTNLPKYNYDQLTEVTYGIEESYESGYYSTVRQITEIKIEYTAWAEATGFFTGEEYILKSSNGYLSTTSNTDAKLQWVNEATAQSSTLATWKATVSNGKVKFTNGAGQILTYNNGNKDNNRYFYATTSSNNYQNFTPVDAGTGFYFYVTQNYYISTSSINQQGRIPSTSNNSNASSRLILTPMEQVTKSETQNVQNWGYQITNTPLEKGNETSLTVQKEWVVPEGYDKTLYEESAVVVRLLVDGVNTGRTVTLTLKNGWTDTFLGLPYKDDDGDVITYTVDEIWEKENWSTTYGEIQTSEGSPPTYATVITNTYRTGGPELPSTGSAARLMYVLCGLSMMLGSLVYGIGSRRKRERRMQ